MSGQQLVLDLPVRPAFDREDFLVAPCNADAVAWLDRWPAWPSQMLIVYGPAGSGKSHLAQVWRKASAAVVYGGEYLSRDATEKPVSVTAAALIDDAGMMLSRDGGPRALLHLLNSIREAGGSLLLTAPTPPTRWDIGLPDLASRLAAAPAVGISTPDDTLLQALLVKLFHDRQVRVSGDVISFLVSRIERSFAATQAITAALDAAALADKQPITVPLASRVLDKI